MQDEIWNIQTFRGTQAIQHERTDTMPQRAQKKLFPVDTFADNCREFTISTGIFPPIHNLGLA